MYEVLGVYVSTGFSTIYRCRGSRRDEDAAIKVFNPTPEECTKTKGCDAGFWRKCFLIEAKVLSGFNHPHIIHVKEQSALPDGTPYYVMPFISNNLTDEIGRDVKNAGAAKNPPEKRPPKFLNPDRAVKILRQLLDALGAVHDQGIVHRDIKPRNILLTAKQEGEVKLCDFGICKVPGPDHVHSGVWLGTLDYISPEQRKSAKQVDARADVFSVGVLAYRMLTGRMPRGAFPMPHELAPEIPLSLSKLVLQAMAPEKESRPRDAGEMLRRLNRVFPPGTETHVPIGTKLNRLGEALGLYRKIFPGFPGLVGGDWGRLSLFPLAIRCIRAYIAEAPTVQKTEECGAKLAQAYIVLGYVLEFQGLRGEAATVYQHAMFLDPNLAEAYLYPELVPESVPELVPELLEEADSVSDSSSLDESPEESEESESPER